VAQLNAAGEKATPIRIEQLYTPLAAKREVEQTLRAIKLAGGQAHYLSVDITDSLDLNTKLAKVVQTTGPITGLIHGAGNIADKWIEKKTAQDFDLVYDTKVKGLENLLQCVPVEQLAQVILFSSIAGFQGNIGQADYALANEVLNKAAHLIKLYQPACRVVSLNWGPWDGGMVTPTLKRIMAQQNIAVIPIALGTQMLVDELNAAELDTTQVVYSSQQQPNSPLISSLMASESRSEGSALRTSRIYRNLRLEVNPFLHDHVIGGQPVLPFTCAIDWMVNASEQLHPNYRFYEGTNLKLLKGIVFPEISERVLILDLKETSFSSNEVSLEAKIWSQADEGQVRYHYQGQVRLVRQLAAAPTFEAFNLAPNQSLSGPELYQNGTLFHGPYFQGVNRVLNINAESLTMQCFLPAMSAIKQGQFPVKSFNPYTTDVQLHSGLIWTNHFYQEGCLPTKLAKLEQFAAIPHNEVFYVTTEIVSKTNTTLVVNSVSHNEQGQIYTRLLGFEATVSKGLATIFEQAVNGHHLGAA
jgi:NAD(P)-dependent dehydrogenase (short-subunit alcohol dehydrogenase family)